jgi:molecular chaperone Hsp31 and glyoxalase 3
MDKKPTVDPAEDNAFSPSRYSLEQYTSAKTDFETAGSGEGYHAP